MRPATLALAASALLLAAGCAPYPTPGGPPPETPAPHASGGSSGEVAADSVPPLDKPKSKWAVGGKSLSDVATGELAVAFMQAGLTSEVRGGAEYANGYDAIRFELDNGTVKGRFILVRPARRPTHKATLATPAETRAKLDPTTSAGVLDESADVYFEISLTEGGKAVDAKRMLDSVIKSGT